MTNGELDRIIQEAEDTRNQSLWEREVLDSEGFGDDYEEEDTFDFDRDDCLTDDKERN